MTTSTERARAWLASDKPMLTWAPLLYVGESKKRHAWEIVVGAGTCDHTVCGIYVDCPTNFLDSSETKDCERCRDAAAAPLAALLDAENAAELEAKVQTYEHIDKVRAMLRVFANELVARGETHDRSKLQPAESKVFGEFTPKLKGSTYGSPEYKGFLAAIGASR